MCQNSRFFNCFSQAFFLADLSRNKGFLAERSYFCGSRHKQKKNFPKRTDKKNCQYGACKPAKYASKSEESNRDLLNLENHA